MIERIHEFAHWLLRRESRSVEDVRREIREEFAFHLDEIRNELAGSGPSESDIQRLAFERFGDPDRYALACEHITFKERFMLQKINFALLVVICLSFAWLFHGNHSSLREQHMMLHSLEAKLDAMNSRTPSPVVAATAPIEPGMIIVRGYVARAGSYMLPTNSRLTALQAVFAAGWGDGGGQLPEGQLVVQRYNDKRELVTVSTADPASIIAGKVRDVALEAGDIVEIR